MVMALDNTLTLLTWEDYIDPQLVTEFEAKTGIQLEFVYFENDEIRDQIMAETTGYGFDVILIDDVEVNSYIHQNWIAPLNKEKLQHLKSHGQIWYKTLDGAETHAVPYGWGTYGITYNSATVQNPPESWSDLFDSTKSYVGHVQMSSQISELLAIALLANGYSANSTQTDELAAAEQSLVKQQEFVSSYSISSLEKDLEQFKSGALQVAMTYNSDSLTLQDDLDTLIFVTPSEGSLMWIDLWAISSKSQHQNEAHQFLNFILDPEIVAQNVEYHFTATFSEDAKRRLPEEILEDATIFPSTDSPFPTMKAPNRQSIRTMMKIMNSIEIN
jgi:spermidine/putrescine transport system substrate-binding protein